MYYSFLVHERIDSHAYDEFGDDGDEVKCCEVIYDGVRKHLLAGADDVNEELIRKLGVYVEYHLENFLLMTILIMVKVVKILMMEVTRTK